MSEDDRPAAAVFFDVDGTLVDSNYHHVSAWVDTFDALDHPVDTWRIHKTIGMDATMLLQELLGEQAAAAVGDRAKEWHLSTYLAMAPKLRPLSGARGLLAAVHDRGLQVVLASSASAQELEVLQRVLDSDSAVDDVTTEADVDTAKPDADLVRVALDKAGVPADRAVFVGDAVWDMVAAGRADVRCIGLLSGGTSRQELMDAGAVEVYDDPADLLAHLDSSAVAELDRVHEDG